MIALETSALLLERYARQMILPGWGPAAQLRLQQARVLVVGAGGLGCPALMYLAAAGVGTLGIADGDSVELSNLHRQVLFGPSDTGQPKAEAAARVLQRLNPEVQVQVHPFRLHSRNALNILPLYDIVLDASDNFATRYLVNDAAVLCGLPCVHASIHQWQGQLSTFHLLRADGSRGPNYRCLYPQPPAPEWSANCAEAGVVGAMAGTLGCMMALEVLKVCTGLGQALDGRLWRLDLATGHSSTLHFESDPNNPLTGQNPSQFSLIDYEAFCASRLPEILPEALAHWLRESEPPTLIDVRTPAEYASDNLGGQNLPLDQLDAWHHTLPRHKPVVLHCQAGARSAVALRRLQALGFGQVQHLAGGLAAYRAWQRQHQQEHQAVGL